MQEKPGNIIADLRYPLESLQREGAERWSQWHMLPIIELSALDTYHFVKATLPRPHLKILEIGCGNGYLSLELARDGHDVTGLDTSQEILTVAERTRHAHPLTSGFGTLTYVCADIQDWHAPEGCMDVVIVNRALHHLPHLPATLSKIKRLLRKDGQFLCQDYAYDRFDELTASWLYAMQRVLFLSGLAQADPATSADEARSIQDLRTTWFQRSLLHQLNRSDEMLHACRATFEELHFSWVPYLFVYIGNAIHTASAEQERACITFLRNMEQYLIERASIQAVGFRFVGHA
ncbi:MAG TPA: class I SAM-dependent methyltransferase [Ktedonosporobacter sp.]|jgi:SAM-dependent methyltransferase|nr:class I SAM-dependent methyltransferase [Ktedonosporobacter sp.]